jgi:hypothetical protein
MLLTETEDNQRRLIEKDSSISASAVDRQSCRVNCGVDLVNCCVDLVISKNATPFLKKLSELE